MKIVVISVCAVGVLNIGWLIIFGIRDYLKRDSNGEIVTNLNIATRNIKGCCVNVVLAIVMLICSRIIPHW